MMKPSQFCYHVEEHLTMRKYSLMLCTAQAELEKLKFFAKPKLALDAVGGPSAIRIADTLAEVNRIPWPT